MDLFHSPYLSLPRGSEKIRNIVTIHDVIPWQYSYYKKNWSYWIYINKMLQTWNAYVKSKGYYLNDKIIRFAKVVVGK